MKDVEFPLYVFHHGTNYKAYDFFGAHPCKIQDKKGFIFRVWAPHALNVSVVGDFNDWNPDANKMERLLDGETFETFIPSLKEYSVYKYCIKTSDGRQVAFLTRYSTGNINVSDNWIDISGIYAGMFAVSEDGNIEEELDQTLSFNITVSYTGEFPAGMSNESFVINEEKDW